MTTRRKFLSSAAALPVAASVASAPLVALAGTDTADAELLALGHEFEAAWANERRVAAIAETDAECKAAWAPTAALVDRIIAMPAFTLPGLKVKARAMLWCGYELDEVGPEMFSSSTTDFHLAGSIIRDLLTMGGKP